MDASGSSVIRAGCHFHIIRPKNSTEGFSLWKRCFRFTLNWLWQEFYHKIIFSKCFLINVCHKSRRAAAINQVAQQLKPRCTPTQEKTPKQTGMAESGDDNLQKMWSNKNNRKMKRNLYPKCEGLLLFGYILASRSLTLTRKRCCVNYGAKKYQQRVQTRLASSTTYRRNTKRSTQSAKRSKLL